MSTNSCESQGSIVHDPLLLDANTAAKRLGISPRLLFTLGKSGEIPVVRIRRRTLYDPADLKRFADDQKSK